MIEPHHIEEKSHTTAASEGSLKDDIELVIFDLHGTLLHAHDRYTDWIDAVCTR